MFRESVLLLGLLLLLFYFTAFLALIKSIIERSLKERRAGSFGWVHSNSNPVIQFSSTTGFQRAGTQGRRQVYAVYTGAETIWRQPLKNFEIKFTLLELYSKFMNMEYSQSVTFKICQHIPGIHHYLRIQNEALKRFTGTLLNIQNKCKSVYFFSYFLLNLTMP